MAPWVYYSVLIGLAVGALIYFAVPGRIRGGAILTMLVGAVAALVSTWLGGQVGLAAPGHTFGFFVAMIGTGLILAIWRQVMGRA